MLSSDRPNWYFVKLTPVRRNTFNLNLAISFGSLPPAGIRIVFTRGIDMTMSCLFKASLVRYYVAQYCQLRPANRGYGKTYHCSPASLYAKHVFLLIRSVQCEHLAHTTGTRSLGVAAFATASRSGVCLCGNSHPRGFVSRVETDTPRPPASVRDVAWHKGN
jgi:hypothetical protein